MHTLTRRGCRSLLPVLFCGLLGVLSPAPVQAWNSTGHQVIARIAWAHMTPEARTRAIELLRAAPADADLSALLRTDARPLADRERELFLLASTWPDLVRAYDRAARREKYHRGPWHYINYFWDERGPGGGVRDRQDLQPEPVNIVERLAWLDSLLTAPGAGTAEQAVGLAWVLHLVGDLHQPLHTSARVTATEPRGDQGGNLFKLNDGGTLHGYWDGILDRTYRKRSHETETAFVDRLAHKIMRDHPRPTDVDRPRPGAYAQWAQEGYATAKTDVYPSTLRRGRAPLLSYRRRAAERSEQAIALAGYRLAALLNHVLAG